MLSRSTTIHSTSSSPLKDICVMVVLFGGVGRVLLLAVAVPYENPGRTITFTLSHCFAEIGTPRSKENPFPSPVSFPPDSSLVVANPIAPSRPMRSLIHCRMPIVGVDERRMRELDTSSGVPPERERNPSPPILPSAR